MSKNNLLRYITIVEVEFCNVSRAHTQARVIVTIANEYGWVFVFKSRPKRNPTIFRPWPLEANLNDRDALLLHIEQTFLTDSQTNRRK